MDVEPSLIEAEVHHADLKNDFYYVKINFLGTGMFITSFVVKRSKYDDQPLWVQPPKFKRGVKWTGHVEFDKSSELWAIIEEKAREAVAIYKAEQQRLLSDAELQDPLTQEDLEKAWANREPDPT